MDTVALIGFASDIRVEARERCMFILVDNEDRENHGDVIISDQTAGLDAINCMASHGRGLTCLAPTAQRAKTLGLRPVTSTNKCASQTSFPVLIEAKEGITTGNAAADHARSLSNATRYVSLRQPCR